MNIYVGNLSFDAADEDLQELFAAHGQVESATIIRDRYDGRSRGFGFVEMSQDEEAQKERLRLLEPWEARIDETILAAGYTSPETNPGYPSGGSLGSQMARSARGAENRAVRSFIEEYILVHGPLPTGTHEISFEFGFYYNGEKQHTVDVEFP